MLSKSCSFKLSDPQDKSSQGLSFTIAWGCNFPGIKKGVKCLKGVAGSLGCKTQVIDKVDRLPLGDLGVPGLCLQGTLRCQEWFTAPIYTH